ncbi:hypothetical protein SAMN02745244_03514 [Tessaracoccus bendigoensis DSM 12906]|uniref:Lipoprotein n=1 Tax=Tessaracoccus bendigoensis DSM 12906 TaxID=1123357 RepID=A0A1M6N0A4_9ACTN|nr:hypothetical protein [Tessaracoccus bendigoensis]SHJ89165.1 hypothetical protein SAMN02745244_03514 [Tessaracoccus bendigoensis DSM 12906]
MRPTHRAALFTLACLTPLAACSPAAESTGSPSGSGQSASPASPASVMPSGRESPEVASALPAMQDDAVARIVARDGSVESTVGVGAEETPYLVHAACTGAREMTYALLVDDVELSRATIACGTETLNSGYSGGGTSVQLELPDLATTPGFHGFAELVPEG